LFFAVLGALASDDTLKVSGDLRLAYLDYKYEDGYAADSYAGLVSAKLSVESMEWKNLYVKASFTTVQGINHDKDKQEETYVFNPDGESYTLLEEAYLGYKNSLLDIKIGRQEISIPYIKSNDYFVTPNSFEAITISSEVTKKTSIDAGHVTQMSGTLDASYDGSTFNSMSKQLALPSGAYDVVGDQAVSYLGGTYTRDAHKLQLWDFYAHEIFNTSMIQYDYKTKAFNAGLQYSMKREVGKLKDSSAYKIHYDVYGAKVGGTIVDKWNLELAYTGVSDDDSTHIFGSWGGYCEFASAYFNTSLIDANIYALTSAHDLASIAKGTSLTLRYFYYDLNSKYTVTSDAPDGYDYMYAYAIEANYKYSKDFNFMFYFGDREMDGGNSAHFFTVISHYTF
jgi:hypothetical protein